MEMCTGPFVVKNSFSILNSFLRSKDIRAEVETSSYNHPKISSFGVPRFSEGTPNCGRPFSNLSHFQTVTGFS